ncbi:Fe2+/Zn2+ uptake regulation protein [Oleiphilus messinensis]|uniref:Fe2+/Zn2+ uptake regulation protein n=1 Tax=Oleiphilus messinensis TaxID=141451 RepID=A0A1Y0IFF8_9GAMM|nr:transcriptional repressor [Oleiphilus messinensis]ARU59258.1 Fe2+/Zn2+ uptake regulation protein [Oleiphilus messinensis]
MEHTQEVIKRAAEKCTKSGSRLTEKRAQILSILVDTQGPLSAYEIVDRYNANAEKSMPPMSAYRILDFLISEQLVHKLSSENKFVACSHILCRHDHQVPQFLICRQCRRVKEIAISSEIVKTLQVNVEEAGYHLLNSQLELDCICDQCKRAQA